MTLWNRFQSIIRWIVRRDDEESRLNAELEAFVEIAAAEKVREGIPAEEARRLARLALGGVEQTKERVRTGRHGGSLDILFQDVRIALRMMRREVGFTTMMILTLAIGIGGITAIFSVVHGVLLRPVPFPSPERIVRTAGSYTPPSNGGSIIPLPLENDWPRRNDVFEEVSLIVTSAYTLLEGGTPELVTVDRVEPNYLSVLQMQPLMGRDFIADEGENKFNVALISYEFWQQRFGGSREILGRELQFLQGKYAIIGILPRGFESPFAFSTATQFWVPATPAHNGGSIRMASIGRLKPGISRAQAEERLNATVRQIESENPAASRRNLQVWGLLKVSADNKRLLVLLFTSVAFIFLIAVINVANLMLSRGLSRGREIAVRAAIGAGRGRLIRQLLTESTLLGLAGGTLGIALGYGLLNLILSQIPQNFPHLTSIYIDRQVLLFAASTSVLGAILFGSLPAWQYSKPDLHSALKAGAHQSSESRGARWLRQCLLGTEIALACVLLVGAALAGQTFWNTLNVPLGLNSRNVVTGTLNMPSDGYPNRPARAAFANAVVERVRHHAEVESVALSSSMPLSVGGTQVASFPKGERVTDQDRIAPIATGVSPDYFDLLRIPLTSGRVFRDGEPALVINETFARQHWGEINPLGSQINLSMGGFASKQYMVSGIVKDQNNAYFANFTTPTAPQVFYPCDPCAVVLIKGKSGTASLPSILQKEVATLDSTVPVTRLRPLDDALMQSSKWANPRFRSTLFTAFSLAALLLALAGAYGVTSYSATQRTREMGIRITLGATHGQVIRTMLIDSLRPVIIGVLIGLIAAWNLSRFAVAFLYKVSPTDSRLFGITAIFLILAVVMANLAPIRRVVKRDPLESLRTE